MSKNEKNETPLTEEKLAFVKVYVGNNTRQLQCPVVFIHLTVPNSS
jgi:hypothetical protein